MGMWLEIFVVEGQNGKKLDRKNLRVLERDVGRRKRDWTRTFPTVCSTW
jgi:hypothetical protein